MTGVPLGDVLLIGAGGHARAVADVIAAEGRLRVAGLVDSTRARGEVCFGHPVLGGEDDVPDILDDLGVRDLVVAIGDNFQRQAMAARLEARVPGLRLVSCRHPSALVGSDVEIGAGTLIMPGVVIVSGCRIGPGCLLNTGSTIDHEGTMGPWSSLAPGAVLGGRVRLGERASVGLGARVIHGLSIGDDTVIGAGAVVVRDIAANWLAFGVPCRPIRVRAADEPYL